MKQESKKSNKYVDGRMQLGIVSDWIHKEKYRNNVQISPEAMVLYSCIAYNSLNRFKKRKVAIGNKDLPFKGNRLYRYRDELVSLGYIGWQNTKSYTLFWLIEPMFTMKNFVYRDDDAKVAEFNKQKESDIDSEIDF